VYEIRRGEGWMAKYRNGEAREEQMKRRRKEKEKKRC
jgi:hypothetical protein